MANLVLVRHGESQWNAENRFTGWIDVGLTPAGEQEAVAAGELLAGESSFHPSVVHTSLLYRAIRTTDLLLGAAGWSYLTVQKYWRLNERHYGALQGLDKIETRNAHGEEQLHAWRRGYATPPPPLAYEDPSHPRFDPRYAHLPLSALPATECLKDVVERIIPYYEDSLVGSLVGGHDVLVVAHGNSLRALYKLLENISDADIADINVPTGIPRLYRYEARMELVDEPRYLGDPSAAAAAAEAVRRQAG
jgi:2,3-bisphosphoglycerate-dependent phosphoglycerate mutase